MIELQHCFHTHAVLTRYLHDHAWLAPERQINAVTKAGEGNMNFTARITLDDATSFILKQSPPYVAKYPQIAAPDARILSEVAFYRATSNASVVRQRLPGLLFHSPSDRLACFEDLGEGRDMTSLYAGERLAESTLSDLLSWLSALHHLLLRPDDWGEALANRAMRKLNHEHIFVLPLTGSQATQLDEITPGLGAMAAEISTDRAYGARAIALGERYLADGQHLLHGDFYPASWLQHRDGVKIIDAEFAFFGPPEFDVGVLIAHLQLAGEPLTDVARVLCRYAPPAHFSADLARAFAGIEVMRRLLGVAQLPLTCGLNAKRALLDVSRTLVLQN